MIRERTLIIVLAALLVGCYAHISHRRCDDACVNAHGQYACNGRYYSWVYRGRCWCRLWNQKIVEARP